MRDYDTAARNPTVALNVAVLGASPKPERYSNKAVALLKAKGHTVFPVHPSIPEIHGTRAYPRLTHILGPIDTVTVYLAPEKSSAIKDDLLQIKPRRVIFNPGAENPLLAAALEQQGSQTLDACTLVLLNTDQF